MNSLNKLWWVTMLRGIVFVLLAFFIFRHPVNALIGVAIYIGIVLLITGLLQTAVSVGVKDTLPNWGWVLTGGLIDIVFGFVLLSNPALTASTLPFVVGFWIIVSGIMSFADAFQNKKEGLPLWGLGMLGGALSIVIGYFIMSDLLVGALAITTWMGIGFAIAGLVNIVIGYKLKSTINKN